MLLVMVDAHSKWIEVHVMTSSTTSATIENLHVTFAQLGVPLTVVTDNEPGFVSAEFKQFLNQNGISHVTSAPYHPDSNGLAEGAVQTVKQAIKKQQFGSLKDKVSRFLFAYRNTPQTATGQTPAELLFGCPLRTRLSKVKLDVEERVQKKQEKQKKDHNSRSRDRPLKEGDHGYVRNFRSGPVWVPGDVLKQTGPMSFQVKVAGAITLRCYIDQLCSRVTCCPLNSETSEAEENSHSFLGFPLSLSCHSPLHKCPPLLLSVVRSGTGDLQVVCSLGTHFKEEGDLVTDLFT